MAKINPIKWSGSKAYAASHILAKSNGESSYFELFLGSGAVMLEALRQGRFSSYVVSDTCKPLVWLWRDIATEPDRILRYYSNMHAKLKAGSDEERNMIYKAARAEFNESGDSSVFFFLLRTCFNGLVRFNSKGEFNSPFHHTRLGAEPAKMQKTVLEAARLMSLARVQILHEDYIDVHISDGSFAFLDPPYGGSSGKMYSAGFDLQRFAAYACSLSGINLAVTLGSADAKLAGFEAEPLVSLSSFKKLIGSADQVSREILYHRPCS